MKKILLAIFALSFLLIMLTGCQQSTGSTETAFTLPNGYVPTAQEIQKLNAITPEAEGIRANALGSRSIQTLSSEERQAMIDDYVALLKKQFAADYKKFYLVREASVTVDCATLQVVDSQPAHFVDPETMESAVSRATGTIDVDTGNGYRMRCTATQGWLWWVTWNDAYTQFQVYTGSSWTDVLATSIYAKVSDRTGVGEVTEYNDAYVKAGDPGDWWTGAYPFSCDTYHRVTYPYITNQDTGVVSYHWF